MYIYYTILLGAILYTPFPCHHVFFLQTPQHAMMTSFVFVCKIIANMFDLNRVLIGTLSKLFDSHLIIVIILVLR